MQYKEALEEVLMNLRCIDITENEQVESYVDDSIRIIKEALEENKDTAQEVPVQEQYEGKCQHCGCDNVFKLSTPLPKGIYPKFCTKCGKDVKYSKR